MVLTQVSYQSTIYHEPTITNVKTEIYPHNSTKRVRVVERQGGQTIAPAHHAGPVTGDDDPSRNRLPRPIGGIPRPTVSVNHGQTTKSQSDTRGQFALFFPVEQTAYRLLSTTRVKVCKRSSAATQRVRVVERHGGKTTAPAHHAGPVTGDDDPSQNRLPRPIGGTSRPTVSPRGLQTTRNRLSR